MKIITLCGSLKFQKEMIFDKNRIIYYNRKHNLRVYLGLPSLSDKGQLK